MGDKAERTDQNLLSRRVDSKSVKADQEAGDATIEETICCSKRWTLAFMGIYLGIITFMLNSNMNIAIVCMVNSDDEKLVNETFWSRDTYFNNSYKYNERTAVDDGGLMVVSKDRDGNVTLDSVGADNSFVKTTKSESFHSQAEFEWDKKTQSVILSSFYYGYIVMQIPAGWLAARFGGKKVIGTSMVVSSLLTLLMPVLARSSVYLVVIARAILGLCIGTSSPSICGLIGTWALPAERSRMLGMTWFGQTLGAVIGYSTSGLLCVHGFDNGWASIFYIQGIISLIFVSSWWFIVYSSPQNHPRISEVEKNLILRHTNLKPEYVRKKDKVPWKNILRYIPVYVVFFAHMCDAWTFYLLVICLPLFLKEVLKFDIESNGVFSCLPYVTFMAGIAFSGLCADLFRAGHRFSITTIRKVFQLTSFIGVAVFILIPGYMTAEHRYGVVACFCLCTFFEAIGVAGGHLPNIIDIAPRYSSLIFGISNTLATIPGIIAPMAVAAITKNGTSAEWRVVFFMTAGISAFASVVYGLFADSETAPWAMDKNNEKDVEIKLSRETVTNELATNGV